MSKLTLYKLCCSCNKEFEMRQTSLSFGDLITTFEDCPHCDARNDTWLRIKEDEDE